MESPLWPQEGVIDKVAKLTFLIDKIKHPGRKAGPHVLTLAS